MRPIVLPLLLSMLAVAGPAIAAPPPSIADASALKPLYDCADKTDPTARLACFDAAVADIRGKEARKEVVTLDQGRVQTLRREAFGFRLPSLPKLGLPSFGDGGKGDEQQIKAISRVSGLNLTTSDGQLWQLTESDNWNPPSRYPFNVVISQAAMGSYLLQIQGAKRSWRARRLD